MGTGDCIAVGIARVVLGALNDDECDGDKSATYFLNLGTRYIQCGRSMF